jgi:hypothetical protein
LYDQLLSGAVVPSEDEKRALWLTGSLEHPEGPQPWQSGGGAAGGDEAMEEWGRRGRRARRRLARRQAAAAAAAGASSSDEGDGEDEQGEEEDEDGSDGGEEDTEALEESEWRAAWARTQAEFDDVAEARRQLTRRQVSRRLGEVHVPAALVVNSICRVSKGRAACTG